MLHYNPRFVYFFTPFFTEVDIVERLVLQTSYVLNKEILQFLGLKSAVYNWERFQIKSGKTIFVRKTIQGIPWHLFKRIASQRQPIRMPLYKSEWNNLTKCNLFKQGSFHQLSLTCLTSLYRHHSLWALEYSVGSAQLLWREWRLHSLEWKFPISIATLVFSL